jgi:hypothetical protein
VNRVPNVLKIDGAEEGQHKEEERFVWVEVVR